MNAKIWTVAATSPFDALHALRSRGRVDIRRKQRILVLDDDVDHTSRLRRLLQESGFDVDVRSDMKFPLTVELFEAYQAVVLDVMMPESNGFDGLRDLRASTELPVLVLTSRDGEEDRIAGLESGADDYVVKPYRPRELVARVRALLRRRSC
jgi:DNA-binding response OmpR family regulator